MRNQPPATTGLPGLDAVLSGIEPGDNIVWEVNLIADYQEFVSPYAAAARAVGSQSKPFRSGMVIWVRQWARLEMVCPPWAGKVPPSAEAS